MYLKANIDSNTECEILKYVSFVQFPSLKMLNLSSTFYIIENNKIVSLEVLCRIHMPQLVSINLSDNHICCVASCLYRTNFPHLTEVVLYANNILQGWHRGKSLQLSWRTNGGEKEKRLVLGINYMVDFHWINKLEDIGCFQFISI